MSNDPAPVDAAQASVPVRPTPGPSVRVWDVPTRLFHWLLVGAVATALLTGFVAPEWWLGVHLGAGYLIVVLLAGRLTWGVLGPEYSRIASMVAATRRLPEHLRGLMMLRPPHHLGHNPAGSVMILALIGVLTALVVTGLLVQGGEEKQGPFAGITSYAVGSAAKTVHSALVWLLLAMIALHITGVLVETLVFRQPILRAMITGWMPLPADVTVPDAPRRARPVAALATLGVLTGAAALGLEALGRLPPLRVPVMVADPQWAEECGACHAVFHPSLLPRASWQRLMAGLDDHFGEDASLPEPTRMAVAAFLDRYAAEAWDTEAARRLAVVDPGDPTRITAAPFWRRKHAGIDPALFATKPVGSRANCGACHRDAATGRFDDQAIALPDPASGGPTS